MTESESATDRNAAAQVLREIADEVASGACKGFGIVCSGGSVGYAAAGLHDANTLGEVVMALPHLEERLHSLDYKSPTVTAITDYSRGTELVVSTGEASQL